MDEFMKRLLLTIAFVIGMMLLAYGLIATGPEKPAMLTLVYYNFMNRVFAAIWWFIQMVVLIAGVAGVAFIIFQVWKAKRNAEEEKELNLRRELIREEKEKIRLEEEKNLQEEMKKRAELEEFKTQQLLLEKDRYLKNRSAEEANKDALKHFL
jgi:hypothetical protein